MSTIKKIAKNTSSLFIAQIITSILALILSIYVVRKLGDINYGKYSFALAFATFFSIFLDFGYNTLFIRNVSRDKSLINTYLNNIFFIRALLSIIIFIFLVITINILNYPLETKIIVYIFGIYFAIKTLSDVNKGIFRVFEKMEYEAIVRIISEITLLILGMSVLYLGYGLIAFVSVYLFTGIQELILGCLISEKKFIKSKTELDLSFFKKTAKIALPLVMLSFFSFVFVKIDTIMLSFMKGDAVVGWYSAAYALTYSFKPFPQMLITALFPLISYYYIYSKDSLKTTYEKSFKYMLLLGLPIALGITLLSDKIIILFYGEQFINSIIALQILSWDVLLIFLYNPFGAILVSMDRQNVMALIFCFTAVLNIALNLVLIPPFSYVGSAIATIVSEGILLIIYIYLLSKYLGKISFSKICIRPIIAVSLMGLFIYFCRLISINLFLIIALSTVLYFIILFLIKGITKEDIMLIKKILKTKKE